MNKDLELKFRMDTGMNPWRYDLQDEIKEVTVPSEAYIEWLEEKHLESLNKNPEKIYFLFGSDACRIYNEDGIDGIVDAYDENDCNYGTACYDGTNILEVMVEFDGWHDWICIEEHEYKQL